MNTATIIGKDFKALVAAACRFPSVGSFAGVDLVNFQVVNGMATASSFGLVLARARVEAEGTMSLVGIDRRSLEQYSGLISEKVKVTIALDGNTFKAKCGRRELKLDVDSKVTPHVLPLTKGMPSMRITKDIAERSAYLADVAYNDSSRAELACVMLAEGGLAIALDQKTFAVLNVSSTAQNVPIPLPLAKQLKLNDILYMGAKETVLVSGIGKYSMPSPVKAQKEFPFALVKKLGEGEREKAAVGAGSDFANAVSECGACVGQLARTETVVEIATSRSGKNPPGRLLLKASNGGAEYTTAIQALSVSGEFVFRIPLDGIMRAVPFLSLAKKVVLSQGKHGDLYVSLGSGWLLFPGWAESNGNKRT